MAHVLDGLSVFTTDGQAVQLGQLWTGRTAVLLFVRHFGCLFCRQQIAELLPSVSRIRASGAELFIVGNGSVEEARTFQQEHQLPVTVLTDPTRQAYCALEMRSGLGTVLRPSVFLRSLKALRSGFRQSVVAGDPLQQGGVVVVGPGGTERYRFISRSAGDHPDPGAILESLAPTR